MRAFDPGDDLLAVEAEALEDARREGFRFGVEAEEQVLGADPAVAE